MHEDDDDIDIQTPGGFRFRAKTHALLIWMFGSVTALGLIVAAGIFWPKATLTITPQEARNGWSADAFESEETAQIVGSLPEFAITGENGELIVQDNSKANVRLWDAVLSVNGQHLPNIPQQVGDCVSWAYCNAGEIVICVEMATNGGEFHRLFPPYVYGTSRVQIGNRRIKGDGSCMAWAVKAGQQFGVLRADADGVPPYSGAIARQWGKEGPPKDLIEATKMFTIGTASPVRSAAEVRDAIANGYPCPFGAGGIGFDRVVVKHGRLLADPPSGSWAHAQCVIGYDGSGAEPLFCILNSWGPLAGGKSPIDGSPPGSYWITERSMQRIASQGDCFAISGFAGFKARKIKFTLTQTAPKDARSHLRAGVSLGKEAAFGQSASKSKKESDHVSVAQAM